MNYKPDFLITPYEVHACDALRPSDSTVYAVVYWFERLKDGKCTASNETIAEVARMESRTVRAALDRLEKNGFIKRIFEVENSCSAKREMMNRLEIKTLVSFTRKDSTEPKIYKVKGTKIINDKEVQPGEIVPLNDEDLKPTPGEEAKEFFNPQSKIRSKIIDDLAVKCGVPREKIAHEIKDFYLYWTEPTKSGKKQLWETKTTFEVRRRIYRWLSKTNKFNGPGGNKAGAGRTA